MKAVTTLVLLSIVVSTGGCRKAPEQTGIEPTPAEVAGPAAEKTPTAPSPAPAEPAPPRIASPGIYYLLDRYSTVTDTGVYGVSPGAKLTRLKQGKTHWLMTDGKIDFEVKPDQVTNDLDVADLTRAADPASKAKLAVVRRERDGPAAGVPAVAAPGN